MSLTGIVSAILAISLAVNATLAWRVADLREDLEVANFKTMAATSTAKACSAAVADMHFSAERQAAAAAVLIGEAKRQADNANKRANAERNRPPAVPGDTCASAEIETREWLERRRTAP